MTFVHVRLTQLKHDDTLVKYLVESFDFNEQRQWEALGYLLLNKQTKLYDFQPSTVWESHKIIPPSLYDLDEAERERLIELKYQDYGWGAWSMLVHHWATLFIKRESFPEYHPLSFFPDRSQDVKEPSLSA